VGVDRAQEASSIDWGGTSALRGPLLGLLLEQDQPIGAYRLSSLLMQRLPTWQVTHSAIANLLKRLVAEGYASTPTGPQGGYVATDRARLALDDWMGRPLSRQTVREDLHARIASASPHHAPLLYRAVAAYERECFDLLDDYGGAIERLVPNGSWRSLTLNLTRAAADEMLHGHIRWSRLARRALRDWVESDSADAVPLSRDDSALA